MKRSIVITGIMVFLLFLIAIAATTIDDFFLPGSQIGQSGNLETPDRCDNCHGGYDQAVEPAFNWRGSMMSQAARDPLFYACLAIANQDAPDVGDLCLRCHTPDGWLNGRCEPTDGSALNNNDRKGVQCDFCHKLVKPTELDVNPFPDDPDYTTGTYPQDQSYLQTIIPIPGTSANGMYIADANNAKRGPFTDAEGRHQMFYSPFHRESALCGTCHDVSNPQFSRTTTDIPTYTYNAEGTPAPSFDLRLMLPVERTYSEWLVSDYNSADGQTCQDCHMRDVNGKGAKMKNAPVRPDLPLHDMTGGNTFVPELVKQTHPSEVEPAALDAGVLRARATLQSAATLDLTVDGNMTEAVVRVTNNTGHKLPTGYPEGRRIWINVKAIDGAGNLIEEFGAYDEVEATLHHENTTVYEIHPGLSEDWAAFVGLPPGPSFHFVLNDVVYLDNRIPPAGCTMQELEDVQSPVVGATYADNQNWDETTYTLPAGTAKVEARLYYQTTTKEYVEFLRDENVTNSKGQEMYDLWVANGKSAPELMAFQSYPPPSLVADILSVTRITAKKGDRAVALAEVTSDNQPVEGVTVVAEFTGPTTGSVSGITDATGQVFLESNKKKNPSGVWCFELTSVTAPGYVSPSTLPTLCEIAKSEQLTDKVNRHPFSIHPNPGNSVAHISYNLDTPAYVKIFVVDNRGRVVANIFDGNKHEGNHLDTWDVSEMQEGIYFVLIQAKDFRMTKKCIISR
jgi:hypothetical protein